MGDMCESAGSVKPYNDPVLRRHREYISFLGLLFKCGTLTFTQHCKGRVGAFCVSKKPKVIDGQVVERQRLVLDCRQVNLLFKPPPLTELGSLSALAELHLRDDQTLYVGGADIKDCFYACNLPTGMQDYFCLATDISFEEVAMISGGQFDTSQGVGRMWSPCISVLPMGFNWSFFLVQCLHEQSVCKTLGIGRDSIVLDGRPAPRLASHGVLNMPYCDNIHCLSTDSHSCEAAREEVCKGLEGLGFELHEEVSATSFFPSLGGIIDGKNGEIKPTSRRAWMMIFAFEYAAHAIVSTSLIQRLLGHAMTICVLNRSGMSIFRHLYDFVESGCGPRRLSPSEQRECLVFAGIVPLLVGDMRRDWSPTVTCTDASPQGFGICERQLEPEAVEDIGRWQERWRFKRLPPECWKPRVRALGLDPFEDLATAGSLGPPDPLDCYVPNDGFPEVPAKLMHATCWRTVKMGRWGDTSEHITLKEARALCIAVRRLSRTTRNRSKRHLVIVDSLALAFSVTKGRAQNFSVLRVLQQIGALCLASGITVRTRWVPSELNVADGPSRGQIRPGPFGGSSEKPFSTSEKTRSTSRQREGSEDTPSGGAWREEGEAVEPECFDYSTSQKDEATGQPYPDQGREGCGEVSARRRSDHLGAEKCEWRDRGSVHTALREVQGLLQGEWGLMASSARGRRCPPRGLPRYAVSAGEVRKRGRKSSSSSGIPAHWGQEQSSQEPSRAQRLAKGSPARKQTTAPKVGHVRDSHVVVLQRSAPDGTQGCRRLRHVLEARRGHGVASAQRDSTCERSRPPVPDVLNCHQRSGGRTTRQDRGLRQQPSPRQPGNILDRAASPQTGIVHEEKDRLPVRLQYGGVPKKFRGRGFEAGTGSRSSLPTQAWGSRRGSKQQIS